MSEIDLPPLPLADWRETRDTLHAYSQLLGKIRRALTPPQRHWWHASLRVAPEGLTTTAMPIPGTEDACEVILNLRRHCVTVSRGAYARDIPLSGHSVQRLRDEVLDALNKRGVQPDIDMEAFADATPRIYDPSAAERYLRVITVLDRLWKQFKAELPGDTSPVQIWPHHFDLSLVWFTGNKVPGVDPEDEEYADEQMAFGFSTGDEGIPDAYVYITAYPWPDALAQAQLPQPARWHLASWKGGLIFYNELAGRPGAADRLLTIFRAAQQTFAALRNT